MASDRIFHDPETGQNYVKLPGNRVVPIRPQDIETIEQGGLAAFGASLRDTLVAPARGAAALLGDERAADEFRRAEQDQAVRSMANPAASMAGQVAGYAPDVALGVATGGGSLAGSIARGAAVEGGLGALRNPEDPIRGAMVQGAVGAVAPAAMAGIGMGLRAARAARNASGVTSTARNVPEALAAEGYRAPFYAGRGNVARQVGAGVESNPLVNVATGAGRRAEDNITAINRLVSRQVLPEGAEAADKLDGAFFAKARNAFSDEFESFGRQIPRVGDDAMKAQLDAIEEANNASLTKSDKLAGIVEDLKTRIDSGRLTGAQVMQDRSDLNTLMRNQFNSPSGDTGLALSLERTIEVLDEAILRAVGPEAAEQYGRLRGRYRIFKNLQKGQAVGRDSDVNPAVLQNNLQRDYGRGTGIESNDLMQGLRYQAEEGVTGIPDSGTATRQAIGQLVTGGLLLGGAGVVSQ